MLRGTKHFSLRSSISKSKDLDTLKTKRILFKIISYKSFAIVILLQF